MKNLQNNNNIEILKKLFINGFFVAFMVEIIHSTASLCDTYFIGHWFGSAGIAASGLSRPFFCFVTIISGTLSIGLQIVCSEHLGRGRFKEAQDVFSGCLFIGLIFGIIFMILGSVFSYPIAKFLGRSGAEEEIILLTSDYLRGLFLGSPAIISYSILSPILQLGGKKNLLTYGLLIQIFIDIVCNIVAVKYMANGMFGIGFATSVSFYLSIIPLIIYFYREDALLKLKIIRTFSIDVIKSGSAKIIKQICNTLKPIILNNLSIILGASLALSAYSITNQVRDVMIAFSAGASSAVLLLGAILYNQRDRNGLETLTKLAAYSVGFVTLVGAGFFAASRPIAAFFITDSDEVIEMAAFSIKCLGVMIPFATMNGIFLSYMQATAKYKIMRTLSYLNRLVLIVAMTVILGIAIGTKGLWIALPASEILCVFICIGIAWRNAGRFPSKLSDFLCLDKDFGFKEEDFIEVNITSMDDIAVMQEKLEGFCKDHGIDERRLNHLQLAFEEVAAFVVEKGFPKAKDKGILHVWTTYEDGNLLIRLQDNCPTTSLFKESEINPDSMLSLKVLMGMAKDVKYINTLETNNYLITI